MSNSQHLDFNAWNKMTVDDLIAKCKQYVAQYFSKSASDQLNEAYKKSELSKVKHILEETQKRIEAEIKVSEYQEAEKAVLEEFPDAKRLFVSSVTDEGSQDDNMGISSGVIAATVIIVAILVITIVGGLIYLKIKDKTVSDILSTLPIKNNKAIKTCNYTEKDRDLMALIHELSVIYDNTDKYMNS